MDESRQPVLAAAGTAFASGDTATLARLLAEHPWLASWEAPGRRTLLHTAACGTDPAIVTTLLAAGAPVTGRLLGQAHGTPLAVALFHAASQMAALLSGEVPHDNLRTAAALGDPNLHRFVSSDGGLTAEARAGRGFQRPLEAYPPFVPPDTDQHTLDEALGWASRNGRVDAMAWLVEHGASIDSNPYRGTALLWAVYADQVEAAAWLLDAGADPDLRHDFGGSEHGTGAVAMHLAAQYSAVGCLDLLLARGADATIRDAVFWATPRGWAEHAGATDSLEVLDRYGVTR